MIRLSGSIPEAITEATSLEFLALGADYLSGQIPSSIEKLVNLRVLSISGYLIIKEGPTITGPIPDSIGNLSKLEHLNLDNLSLSGRIPESIGNLVRLNSLTLSHNHLTGPIPKSIGNLTSLTEFSLKNNRLSGHLADNISSLELIRDLDLSDNRLTGPIPESIVSFPNLRTLDLSGNHLTGPLVDDLVLMPTLQFVDLSYNSLSSPLDRMLVKIPFGESYPSLDLSYNKLIGTIPADFGDSEGRDLRSTNFSGNFLTGEIPKNVTTAIILKNNYFDLDQHTEPHHPQYPFYSPETWLAERNLNSLNEDSDQDGLPNLIEYAFALNPQSQFSNASDYLSHDSELLPRPTPDGVIGFTVPPYGESLIYTIEISANLEDWSALEPLRDGSTYKCQLPQTSLAQFWRFAVSQ